MVEEVGRGAEGSVWRGRWHHIDVAVKEMHPKSTSFSRLAELAKDMQSGNDTGTPTLPETLTESRSMGAHSLPIDGCTIYCRCEPGKAL